MDSKTDDELAKILWDYNRLGQGVEKADIIIVLGSHDTRVAEYASELMLKGLASLIVFSGGLGRLTDQTWTRTEAEVFSEIAVTLGVPVEKILLEDKSTNTGENITFSKELLDKKGIHFSSVILVHKPYMERRAFASWKMQYPDIKAKITSPQLSYEEFVHHGPVSTKENISIIVGDTQRIPFYVEKGYLVKQEMPQKVWEAYEELVRRGYTSQLVNFEIT